MDERYGHGSHFPAGHGGQGSQGGHGGPDGHGGQSGHGGFGHSTDWADDPGGTDPADQWVLDPVTGEYRLRLPGESAAPDPAGGATGSADTPSWQAETAPVDRTAELSVSELLPARVESSTVPRSRTASRAVARRSTAREEPSPGPRSRSASRTADRRSRRGGRRRDSRGAGGLWLAGTLALVGVVGCGTGGYLLFHDANGGVTACAAARASAAPDPQLSGTPLPPGPTAQPLDVRVTVLNGSGVFGAAESVLAWMQNKQLYSRTSNGGPAKVTATTSLVYAPDHVDQARTLAAAMHLPAYTLHGTGKGTGLRDPMILTLGKDFKTAGRPLAPPPTPSTAAAQGGSGKCGG